VEEERSEIQEMPHAGDISQAVAELSFQFTIGDNCPAMLSNVLRQGTHHERFQIAIRTLQVLGQTPSGSTIPTPHTATHAHRPGEFRGQIRMNLIFNSDQDWAARFRIQWDDWQSPVLPRRKIYRFVRNPEEQSDSC